MNNKRIKILLVVLAFVVCGVIYAFVINPVHSDNESIVVDNDTETVVTETSETETTSKKKQNCVYVCGAVLNPGVYYLDEGSRICDAVDAAGGFTEDAAKESVNLASCITDEQQIYIPSNDETAGQNLYTEGSSEDGLVNLNSASKEELMTIPGIGETKAASIISYREENGAFSSIDEIVNVSGIGEATFEKIKNYIKV